MPTRCINNSLATVHTHNVTKQIKMKKALLISLVLFNVQLVHSQNLVVGYLDPNEILNLTSGTYAYDTVFVVNNGTLNITNNTQFVVNDIIALNGTGKLNVENSYFEVNNIFAATDTSIVNLKDSLNLACNFIVLDYSTLNIDSATVEIPMTYKGEFGWNGFNNSNFNISNSDFDLGAGALQGSFSDSANFIQINNQFVSSTLPMTLALSGNSITSIDSCTGGMEFVINEHAKIIFTHVLLKEKLQIMEGYMKYFTREDNSFLDWFK